MRIGIFSDIHGNAEALDIVLKALDYECVDCRICLGDLVGYGPCPNQCIERSEAISDIMILGNHDAAAVGQIDVSRFNEYARIAMDWTREILTPASIKRMKDLPIIEIAHEITWVHATPSLPDKWRYIFTNKDARQNFKEMKTQICFVGHSHAPVAFVQDENDEISVQDANNITFEANRKYIINVGSVGQPRDGDPRASYGVLDTDEGRFHLQRLPYPVKIVQKIMQEKELPQYLIDRIAIGQ